MKRRLAAMFACLIVAASLLGAIPAQASQPSEETIITNISKTYQKIRKWRRSYNGYCGAFVHRQIYVLGITNKYNGANGNNSYDLYKNEKKTSGNYEVNAYSAKKYTLKAALQAVTENGRRQVSNVMVGFQVGMSAAGKRYGHVVFIHGIIGNTVYFSESYTVTLDDVAYKEGAPLVCSIDEFVKLYRSCQFEGVIHFVKAHKHTYDEKGYCTVCGKRNTDPKLAPVISKQPVSVSAGVGKTARVTVSAKGEGLQYTWYFKNPGEEKFQVTNSYKKASYSLKMTESNSGRQVYCVITDKKGKSVQTDVATLSTITITQQPTGAAAADGKVAKAQVEATGTGLTYQWYIKSKNGSTFTKSSVKKAVYSCKMSKANSGRQVYCVITDAYGNAQKTETVTLSCITVTKQPKSVAVANGKTAKVTVTAAGEALAYKWFIKSANGSNYSPSSIKSVSYSMKMTDAKAGRMVYCVITDKYGNSVQTNVALLGKR